MNLGEGEGEGEGVKNGTESERAWLEVKEMRETLFQMVQLAAILESATNF